MRCAIKLVAMPLVCASSASAFVPPLRTHTTNPPKFGVACLFHDASTAVIAQRRYSRCFEQQPPPCRANPQHQRQQGKHAATALNAASGIAGATLSSTTAISALAWVPASILLLLIGGSVVNALQGGVRGDLGKTPEKILGVPAQEATGEDVAKLSKAGFVQLFYSSTCPAEGDLDGEYRARMLPMGVMHPISSIIANRVWGPGWWLGKAFSAGSPEGYNIFSPQRTAPSSAGSSNKGKFPDGTLRERFFGFSTFANSVFDGGESSELDYGRGGKNGPLFGGMRDEVRKVNDHLYVGLGYIEAFGGKYCNTPFIVEGPPAGKFSHPNSK